MLEQFVLFNKISINHLNFNIMSKTKKDVFAIYEEIKDRILGVSDRNPEGIDGFLVSYYPSAMPINEEDYKNPWSPHMSSPNNVQPPVLSGEDSGIPDTSDIARSYKSLSNTCTLVDSKIEINEIYQAIESGGTISEAWELIIKGANVMPADPLQEAFQKEQFEKYYPRLRKTKKDEDGEDMEIDTKEYKAYKRFQDKYADALQDYATEYMIAMSNRQTAQLWGITGKRPLMKVNRALDEWASMGSRKHIEEAMDNLAAMGTDASAHMISEAKKLFEAYSIATKGVIPSTSKYVELFPSNWCDKEATGWTTYEYEWSKETENTKVETTSMAASGGVSVGLWSAKANVKFDKRKEHKDKQVNSMKIELSYKTVNIKRPWLRSLMFDLNNWFLVGNIKKGAISTGKMDQVLPRNGSSLWLPTIPTKLIIIKDVVIESKELCEHYDAMKKELSVDGSIGYGPFSLSGSYSNSTSTTKFEAETEGEKLKINGIQIIGVVSSLVQLSPKIDAPIEENS